jgi:hypothetical protein
MERQESKSYLVHFANGQGDGTFGSLEYARRVIQRRGEQNPPPPVIFPAEIWERTWVDHVVADERLIARFTNPLAADG